MIKKSRSGFKYKEAADIIIDLIKSGEYNKKLPGERVIAENLNCSYTTIRNALQHLEKTGIIDRIQRKGNFSRLHFHENRELKITFIINENSGSYNIQMYYEIASEISKQSVNNCRISITYEYDDILDNDIVILFSPPENIYSGFPELKLVKVLIVDGWNDYLNCSILCPDYSNSLVRELEKIQDVRDISIFSSGIYSWRDRAVKSAVEQFSRESVRFHVLSDEKLKEHLLQRSTDENSVLIFQIARETEDIPETAEFNRGKYALIGILSRKENQLITINVNKSDIITRIVNTIEQISAGRIIRNIIKTVSSNAYT